MFFNVVHGRPLEHNWLFRDKKREKPLEAEECLFAVKKASLRHHAQGPWVTTKAWKRVREILKCLCAKTDFNIQGSWGEMGAEKRMEEMQTTDRCLWIKNAICVCLWCFFFLVLGDGGWWRRKLEHSLIQGYKKNQVNSAQFHTIPSITPLIIQICAKNKNTNIKWAF